MFGEEIDWAEIIWVEKFAFSIVRYRMGALDVVTLIWLIRDKVEKKTGIDFVLVEQPIDALYWNLC